VIFGDPGNRIDSNAVVGMTSGRVATSQSTFGILLQPVQGSGKARWTYRPLTVLGRGSFGTVYLSMGPSGERVALKKVKAGPLVAREVMTMMSIESPFCMSVLDSFQTDDEFLWIVTELMPESLGDYTRRHHQTHQQIPPLLVKLFAFQLFAGLADIHSLGIMHRDIKTDNCLVDAVSGRLLISDFGNAKVILPDSENTFYIASRIYRAPELLLNCSRYDNKIDIWAAGCVVAEVLLDAIPMFQGSSNEDHLVQIMRVLGPPSRADVVSFEHPLPFPTVEHICSLENALPLATPRDLLALLKQIFSYSPAKRPTAAQCMKSPYFDELYSQGLRLPSGRPLPPLPPRK
jgi:glycogen synthase kinase 3 beta